MNKFAVIIECEYSSNDESLAGLGSVAGEESLSDQLERTITEAGSGSDHFHGIDHLYPFSVFYFVKKH